MLVVFALGLSTHGIGKTSALSPHLGQDAALVVAPPPVVSYLAPANTPGRFNQADHNKLVAFISNRYAQPPKLVSRIVQETNQQAKRRQMDPLTVLAVIAIESSFNPLAVSNRGAMGLAQVLPQAHPDKVGALYKAGKSLTDIKENIRMGVDILSECRTHHNGDMRLALLRYNGSSRDRKSRYANKVWAMQAAMEEASGRKPVEFANASQKTGPVP